ncbi:MAG TPA: hypothetical protein VFC19_19160 [Candidatus Limnocylindrales bacterium]|nr:hypothetical protein [Candidatus Limnocylindrales bacterium]
MRIRVFAGIGIAAALLGLTGCRSSPTVAAYVGDQTLTEDKVTELIDGYMVWAQAQAVQNGQKPEQVEKPNRTQVVNYLVRGHLCEQARRKLKFNVEQPNLPPEQSDLAVVAAQTLACERALPAGEPVKPTEADVRQIFDIGVANGIFAPESEAEAIPGLMNDPGVAEALGRKKALNDALAGIDVTVNPKYGVVEMPLASFQGGIPAVSLTFGEPGPVNDRPVQPSAPPQPAQ